MPYFIWDIGMILVNAMQDLWEIHALLGSQLEDRQDTTGISSGTDNYIKTKKTDMKDEIQLSGKDTYIYLHALAPTIISRDANFNSFAWT